LQRILPDHDLPDADIVALLGSEQRQRSARTMRFLALLKGAIAARPWRDAEVLAGTAP
jgi:hypothetical protein